MLNWFYTFYFYKNGEFRSVTIPAHGYKEAEKKFRKEFGDTEIEDVEIEM